VVGILSKPAEEMPTPPSEHTPLGRALMTQQDRWWIAISIVWFFLTLGMLLYLGFA
jgi:hypothetical protein